MSKEAREMLVNCEEGRRLGCATFCCRLLVRLDPDERTVGPDGVERRFIEKRETDGLCIHCDPETYLCGRWETRPRICREFDCNGNPLLQVVLRDGFTSLVDLVTAEVDERCPPAQIESLTPDLDD